MKYPDEKTVSRLADLRLVGIHHPQDLLGKEPFQLYRELFKMTNEKHDPCVIDVFVSVVHFLEDGAPVPWWFFTDE